MTNLFIQVLGMNLTATYCIIFVCVVRLLLKKAPRIFSYILWSVVAFRLICPFSFEGMFSLIGERFLPSIHYEEYSLTNEYINITDKEVNVENNMGYYQEKKADNHQNAMEKETVYQNYLKQKSVNQEILDIPENNMKNNTDFTAFFSYLWIVIACILGGYGFFTFIRLKHKLKVYARKTSTYLNVDVWQVRGLDSPFVLGLFHPAIYLPENLVEKDCVQCLAHEYTHIRRKDYLIKQFSFFLVCIHWFNPFVWLAFYLMTKDMEMSCDEVAIRSTSLADRKAYSGTLLELSSTNRYFNGCPLAFGANSTKARIKHIMNYKRPSFWVMILGIILVLLCIVGLSTNPKREETNLKEAEITSSVSDEQVDLNISNDNEADNFSIKDYYDLLLEHRRRYQEYYTNHQELEVLKKEISLQIEALNQQKELPPDKAIDLLNLQQQLEIYELNMQMNLKMILAKEAQMESISDELALLQLTPESSQLQGQQTRLFAQIENQDANNSEDYIVFAYDTYTDIDNAFSHKSIPQNVHEKSIVHKLHKGDMVEIIQYGYESDVSEDLTSQYALICWEPDNIRPETCGYVRADYLNVDLPENTNTAYMLMIGKYWAALEQQNDNIIPKNILPLNHVAISSPNTFIITYFYQESEDKVDKYLQTIELTVPIETLGKEQTLSELCLNFIANRKSSGRPVDMNIDGIVIEEPEILDTFTEYLNRKENNAFVTTIYNGKRVNLTMLLYDAGAMLDNAPLKQEELEFT